jgi:hypothetical protein
MANNPVSLGKLNSEWQQCGFELLEMFAEVKYWPGVSNSGIPGAVREWHSLREVETVELFREVLKKLQDDIRELKERE